MMEDGPSELSGARSRWHAEGRQINCSCSAVDETTINIRADLQPEYTSGRSPPCCHACNCQTNDIIQSRRPPDEHPPPQSITPSWPLQPAAPYCTRQLLPALIFIDQGDRATGPGSLGSRSWCDLPLPTEQASLSCQCILPLMLLRRQIPATVAQVTPVLLRKYCCDGRGLLVSEVDVHTMR